MNPFLYRKAVNTTLETLVQMRQIENLPDEVKNGMDQVEDYLRQLKRDPDSKGVNLLGVD